VPAAAANGASPASHWHGKLSDPGSIRRVSLRRIIASRPRRRRMITRWRRVCRRRRSRYCADCTPANGPRVQFGPVPSSCRVIMSHVRAGYDAVGQVRTAVRAAPLQIDQRHIALPAGDCRARARSGDQSGDLSLRWMICPARSRRHSPVDRQDRLRSHRSVASGVFTGSGLAGRF
jgi:hypothetical protein